MAGNSPRSLLRLLIFEELERRGISPTTQPHQEQAHDENNSQCIDEGHDLEDEWDTGM